MEAQKISKQQRRSPNQHRDQMIRRQPRRKKRSLWWLWLSLAAVGLLSASAGALLALSFGTTPLAKKQLTKEEAAFFRQDQAFSRGNLQFPELTRPVNILLLGVKTNLSDLRDDHAQTKRKELGYDAVVDSFDGLSDTMMLLRFDPTTKQVVVLGIPRDTKVEIPGKGANKINAVNAETGPAMTAKVVSDLLQGVAIDRYIRVNVQGVEKLIDSLGGVTVDVPRDIKYQDDSQHLYINLKKGKQHLSGEKALGLLRFRYDANGDLGRIQRQQMVMKALMEQALNPLTVARIPQILSVIQSHLDTNLTVEELLAIGGFGLHTNKSKPQSLILPGDFNGDGKHSTSYWLPDEKEIASLTSRYFDHGTINLSEIKDNSKNARILIQDSSNSPKFVENLIQKLRKAGYTNVHIDKPINPPLTTTSIIAQRGNPLVAQELSKLLGFGDPTVETSGNLYSDITIKLGLDWAKK